MLLVFRFMVRKLYAFTQGKCAEESADSPMMQEVLLGGHLYNMMLKVCLEVHVRQAECRTTGSEFMLPPP